MHDVGVGQAIPLSSGGAGSDSGWADQVVPPLVVATITVTGAVVVVDALGPATPTAQQCSASAHETAPSSPVPAGAGCPITVASGDCWPRTLAEVGGGFLDALVHDDTASAATDTRTTGTIRLVSGQPRPTQKQLKADTAVGQ
jgi:hypothetical protein